jgi:hypothetical protein
MFTTKPEDQILETLATIRFQTYPPISAYKAEDLYYHVTGYVKHFFVVKCGLSKRTTDTVDGEGGGG